MDSLSVKLLPIEHRVWRELKTHAIQKKTLILTVSGGLDSMALMTMLRRLQPLHQCDISVLHIHHGPSNSKRQLNFRDKSSELVKLRCAQLGILCRVIRYKKKKILNSEEEYRNFRQGIFKNELKPNAYVVTAHHGDDLLETQLIRLARGTGTQGLPSMMYFNGEFLRPFLLFRRSEILSYAQKLQLNWNEDPSNKVVEPLRNWMRQVWLPQLELKAKGSISAMIRSFSLLSQNLNQSLNQSQVQVVFVDGAILRTPYYGMGITEQRSVIADYLMRMKIKNYTSRHVEEIRRRLDNRRVQYRFTLLKHEWQVNAERILAAKV